MSGHVKFPRIKFETEIRRVNQGAPVGEDLRFLENLQGNYC